MIKKITLSQEPKLYFRFFRLQMQGICLLLLLTGSVSSITAATIPAFEPTGGNNLGVPTQSTLRGFTFTPQADLSVSALGVFDVGSGFNDSGDGLAATTAVGLYRVDSPNSGTLLQRVDIPAGTTATLVDEFRYLDIAPIQLSTGQQYELISFHSSSGAEGSRLTTNPNPHPALLSVQPVITQSNSFTDLAFIPTSVTSGSAGFGPNFLFDVLPGPNFEFVPTRALNAYEAASNWNPLGPPGFADQVRFSASGSYDVVFNSSPTNQSLLVFGGNVTFRPLLPTQAASQTYTIEEGRSISSANLSISGNGDADFVLNAGTNPQSIFSIGSSTTGSLTILPGGTVRVGSNLSLGRSFNGDGTISVIGDSASLEFTDPNFSNLEIGRISDGTLVLQDGGAVSSGDAILGLTSLSSGEVTVEGAGSSWTAGSVIVGNGGSGTLNIRNQGAVVSTDFGTIGNLNSSFARATVDGAGSSWTMASDLTTNNGVLGILNGGNVSNSSGIVANNAGSISKVTLIGPSSAWNNSSSLIIGNEGDGSLAIFNEATVTNTTGSIGLLPDGIGEVEVDGSGSQWNNSANLRVGVEGDGTLEILDGGSVSNQLGIIGDAEGSSGQVTVDGASSIWTSSSQLLVGNRGNGTLLIQNGSNVTSLLGIIGSIEGSNGQVTVDGPNSMWSNSNQLLVGNHGNGTLLIQNGSSISNSVGRIGEQGGSVGNVVVDGATWTNSGSLFAGNEGNGTLEIRNGGNVSNTLGVIADGFDSISHVTVNGADSSWINSESLIIGENGNATLIIQNGANVSNTFSTIARQAGSTSQLNVEGNGSTWNSSHDSRIGQRGHGTLIVRDGAIVSNRIGIVGDIVGSTGLATINGLESVWTNSSTLSIGNDGNGTLEIFNGGEVSNTTGSIGVSSNGVGEVTVNGIGSNWNSSGNLRVGVQGNGILRIQNGATISSRSGIIGDVPGSTGYVLIEGEGSTWTNTTVGLYVGGNRVANGGAGRVDILSGAIVNVDEDTRIYTDGQLNLFGGTLSTDSLDDDGGVFNWLAGRLNVTGTQGVNIGSTSFIDTNLVLNNSRFLAVTNKLTVESSSQLTNVGGNVTASDIEIQAGGLWTVLGGTQDVGSGLLNDGTVVLIGATIEGSVTSPAGSQINVIGDVIFNSLVSGAGNIFGGGTAIFNGGHSPGDSPAVVTVEGNLIYGSGNMLTIELDGLSSGEFDQLEILGNATLDGTLALELLPGFTPNLGDEFTILDIAGSISGEFANLSEGEIFSSTNGQLFQISYTGGDGNNVTITAVPEPGTLALALLSLLNFVVSFKKLKN